jgi:RHS repeat-associated protein
MTSRTGGSGANQVAVTATDGSGWEHRAYWGANQIPWGTDGTESRRYQGSLPATGQWVRLEVDAASVGLSGRSISGMAYSQVGGQADWDHSGKVSATGIETTYVDDALPAGATPYGTWTWGDTGLNTPVAFTGHHYHPRSTLHLAPYRAYSADLGRWLSRDPLQNAEQEEGPNLYAYCADNPLTHVDPLGLEAKPPKAPEKPDECCPDTVKNAMSQLIGWVRNIIGDALSASGAEDAGTVVSPPDIKDPTDWLDILPKCAYGMACVYLDAQYKEFVKAKTDPIAVVEEGAHISQCDAIEKAKNAIFNAAEKM